MKSSQHFFSIFLKESGFSFFNYLAVFSMTPIHQAYVHEPNRITAVTMLSLVHFICLRSEHISFCLFWHVLDPRIGLCIRVG